MSRRKDAFDAIFEAFVKEGRELGVQEAKRLYPLEMAALRRASGGNVRVKFERIRRIYADRWHEIYDQHLNIVHEEPVEEAPEPVLSPLEKLRKATRKENE